MRSVRSRTKCVACSAKTFDPAMFDNPEVRQQVLDGVVNQRLLRVVGQDLKLTVPDAQLRQDHSGGT